MTDRDDARSVPPHEPRRRVERPPTPSAPGWPPPPAVPPERYSPPRRGASPLGPPPRSAPEPIGRPGHGPPPGTGHAPPPGPSWDQAPPGPPGSYPPSPPGSPWGYGQAPPQQWGGTPAPQGPPAGYGYGPPPGQRPPGHGPLGPAAVRHRPGAGLVVGLVGLVLLVASLTALPWISVGGEDATLSDLRDAYSALDGLDVGDGGIFTPPDVTLPDISVPDVTLPDGSLPDDGLGPVVTPPGLPGTSEDTYTVPPSADTEPYHELYVKGLCWAVAVWAAFGLVAAALWVPRSKGGRTALGFVVGGVVGLAANALDEGGRVGPRVTGAFVALVCLAAHGVAVAQIFGEDGAPDPAIGAWAGGAGILLVLVGCAIGTRTDAAAPRW